jgi:RNA recognition motif-containing protein
MNGMAPPSSFQAPSPAPFGNQQPHQSPFTVSQFQAAIAAAASAQYHNNQTAAAAAAVAAASGQNRTVYMGGLPQNVTYEEVMNHVRFGAVEQVKLLEEKNCAFVTFIESAAAMAFFADAQARRILVGGQEIKVGWGKPSHCSSTILAAVQSGATRNVFIGNLDDSLPESVLTAELSRFGPIDQVKILPDKKIAFIHLTSVSAAMKAVSTLPNEPRFVGRRVNYGKDRCGGYGIAAAAAVAAAANAASSVSPRDGPSNVHVPNPQNRTVYLGGIHPDVTTKDICDVSSML